MTEILTAANEKTTKVEKTNNGEIIVNIKDLNEVPKGGKRAEKKVYKLEDIRLGNYTFFGNGRCMKYYREKNPNGTVKKGKIAEKIMINSDEVLSLLPQIQKFNNLRSKIGIEEKLFTDSNNTTIKLYTDGGVLGLVKKLTMKNIPKSMTEGMNNSYNLYMKNGKFIIDTDYWQEVNGQVIKSETKILNGKDEIDTQLKFFEDRIKEYKRYQESGQEKQNQIRQEKIKSIQTLLSNDAKQADDDLEKSLSQLG